MSTRAGRRRSAQPVGPLLALLGVACLLVAVLVVIGGGVLGTAAVLVSVAGTAALWLLLPAGLGGPTRPGWRRHRMHRPVRGRR